MQVRKHSLKELADKLYNETQEKQRLLRYIERIYGVDIESLKNSLLTDETRASILSLGDGIYRVKDTDDYHAVVKNGVVMSVVED